jgi:hypothetical protein
MHHVRIVIALAAAIAICISAVILTAEEKKADASAKTPETAESTSTTGTAAAATGATATAATDTAAGEEPEVKPGEGPLVKLKNLRVYVGAKRVEMDGKFAIHRGLIELLVCTPYGKNHESLAVADIDPWELKAALLLIGLKDGYRIVTVKGTRTVEGERVIIHIRWTDEKGKVVTKRAEELVYNVYTEKAMKHAGWVFIGSRFAQHSETGVNIFAAKARGNIIVTWHDFDSILDTPLPEGADDTTYRAYEGRVPAKETKITLIITPDDKHNKKWREKLKKEEDEKKKSTEKENQSE